MSSLIMFHFPCAATLFNVRKSLTSKLADLQELRCAVRPLELARIQVKTRYESRVGRLGVVESRLRKILRLIDT